MFLEMRVSGIALDPFTNTPIVILKDNSGDNILPIWVGYSEASSIAMELEKTPRVRPITHDLMKSVLDMVNCTISKIEVTELKDNTFYSLMYILKDGKEIVIDSRPSDAIAIALRMGSPIFVNEQVIASAQNIEIASDKKRLNDLLDEIPDEEFGKYKM
ncbi:MAG: bifunctional nuclease family protein [Thermodesulfobacteriota bacterium]